MRLSFVLPTIGRPTLPSVLQCLKEEMGPDDEALVVSEGELAREPVAQMVAQVADRRFLYWGESSSGRLKGNGIRDSIIARARGDFLFFIDDDDLIPSGAIAKVHAAIELEPNRPHLFAMVDHGGSERRRHLGMCEVGGPQFVPPNDPEKLGRWANMNETGADWIFIDDTLTFYPEGPVFHDDIIYLVGRAKAP